MKQITILFLCFLTISAYSQSLDYTTVKFAENASLHKFEEAKLDSESAVIINDSRHIQIIKKGEKLISYITNHKIIKVNDDAGIEKFNKVYIPINNISDLIDIQVRTIDLSGTIKNFNQDNLKEIENLDGHGNYKIFAVEGLEKGGELEYIYTIKKKGGGYGREVFQQDAIILEANFELIYPAEYTYSTKSYNGFPNADSTSNCFKILAKNIPALTKEAYSSYKSKLMRVDYIWARNEFKHKTYTWDGITRSLYHSVYKEEGSDLAKKFVSNLKLDGKSDFEKLVILEKEIKENFTIKYDRNEMYWDIKQIFKNHIADDYGITKMYIKCLEVLKIQFDIVYTESRFLGSIDPKFAHYLDLRDVLFYFPTLNKYLSPTYLYMRIGYAPEILAGNNALFLHTKFNKNYNYVLNFYNYAIKNISNPKPENNKIGVEAEINFNNDLTEALVKQRNFSQGYRAFHARYSFAIGDDKKKQNLINKTILSAIDDANIISNNIENGDLNLSVDSSAFFYNNLEYSTKSIVEKAGNDILFSVGKIIGKQSELYEEKERNTDVLLPHTKQYEHKITINIPSGFECKGLDKLKIDNQIIEKENILMKFVSDYKIENNQVIISISEHYNVLELDKSYYNDYRKVINSAADFNKIVLVFEPKS